MRVTRKALQAENTQLRDQIAVHDHDTRRSLNDMMRQTLESNKYLMGELGARDTTIELLKARLQESATV